MKANARHRHYYCVPLICVAMGCTISLSSLDGDTELSDAVTIFEDDEDSATGALDFKSDQLLVQPFPGASDAELGELFANVGVSPVGEVEEIQLVVLEVPDGRLDEAAEALAESELIESIHKNYVLAAQETPDDPLYAQQWYLPQVHADAAWDAAKGGEDVVVAVVDTGVEMDHPELAERITDGWNIYDGNDAYDDAVGHGTGVAGILAAQTDNQVGIAGVTWSCPLLAVRVTDDEGLTTSRHVAAGILWAASNGAKVVNVSFAPLWANAVVRSAVRQVYHQGVLVVISAGNAGGTTRSRGYEEAVFVGAVDSRNALASFSDKGPFVDLVAPGVGVHTTTIGGSYATPSGTSFSAPIVAGAAALAWSTNIELRPVSIVSAMAGTADDLGDARKDDSFGYGLLDIAAAVDVVAATAFVRDTQDPVATITYPADRARKTGRFAVSVSATDDKGVADVVLSIDDVAYATDTRLPYRFVVDANRFAAGSHEITAVATDTSGNPSDPATVVVTFGESSISNNDSRGSVEFTSPAANSVLTRDTTIRANVSAGAGIATVEWFVDGESVLIETVTGLASVVSYTWRVADVPDAAHTITLALTDAVGRVTRADLPLTTR